MSSEIYEERIFVYGIVVTFKPTESEQGRTIAEREDTLRRHLKNLARPSCCSKRYRSLQFNQLFERRMVTSKEEHGGLRISAFVLPGGDATAWLDNSPMASVRFPAQEGVYENSFAARSTTPSPSMANVRRTVRPGSGLYNASCASSRRHSMTAWARLGTTRKSSCHVVVRRSCGIELKAFTST